MEYRYSLDGLIVMNSILAFALFFLIHVVTFRLFKTDKVFKGIINTFIGTGILTVVISGCLIWMHPPWLAPFNLVEMMMVIALTLFIYGLMAFVYILCIFGPSETSIRMRLVRELHAAGPQGLTLNQWLRTYNSAMILDVRLQRLMGARDVILKEGRYYIQQQHNMFFIIDVVAQRMQQWIDKKGLRNN